MRYQSGREAHEPAIYGPAIYGPATYGDDFADVYDDWYGDLSDPQATAQVVAELTSQGERVLELGVGTGRLALAIAAKGIAIDGIDSSAAMLEQLATKDPQGTVGRVLGDFGAENFAAASDSGLVSVSGSESGGVAPGPYQVVFAAYNTFFNLTSQQAQLRCLRAVAQRLKPDGVLLIEAFLPATGSPAAGSSAVDSPAAAGPAATHPAAGSSAATHPTTESALWPNVEARRQGQSLLLNVSVQDTEQQLVSGRHIEVRLPASDSPQTEDPTALASIVRIRSWQIRYLSPSQLDELAKQAGFELSQRWADWHRNPFDANATQHISVYRKAVRTA